MLDETLEQEASRLLEQLASVESLRDGRAVIKAFLADKSPPHWTALGPILRSWNERGVTGGTERDAVENYILTFCPPPGVRKRFSHDGSMKALPPELSRHIVMMTNSARGQIYETTFGQTFVRELLEKRFPGEAIQYDYDRLRVGVPQEGNKFRRYDILAEAKGVRIGVEIKSGRVSLTSFIRRQIEKDRALLKHGAVGECYWLLYRGASKGVLHRLDDAGIAYFDLAFDVEDEGWVAKLMADGGEHGNAR